MHSPEEMDNIRKEAGRWRKKADSAPQRKTSYQTPSQIPVEPVYTPADLEHDNYVEDIGYPGEFPWALLTAGHPVQVQEGTQGPSRPVLSPLPDQSSRPFFHGHSRE